MLLSGIREFVVAAILHLELIERLELCCFDVTSDYTKI